MSGAPPSPASSSPDGTPGRGAWLTLFDGAEVAGLRGYGHDEFPVDHWAIEDGALRTIPGPGVDLITDASYADFELEFEWRVSPGGNSGVIYRVVESAEPAWVSGPEYQILDDELHPDGRNPATSAAALYDLLAPGPGKHLESVGDYNTGRIVVRDGHVEHWLNGDLVVEYEWDGPAIRERIAGSKFATLAGFMRQPAGQVVFQHHGEEAWLRAIRIRPLDGSDS